MMWLSFEDEINAQVLYEDSVQEDTIESLLRYYRFVATQPIPKTIRGELDGEIAYLETMLGCIYGYE